MSVQRSSWRTRIPGISATEPVKLSLVALGPFTRQSAPVKTSLRQKRPKPVKLAL